MSEQWSIVHSKNFPFSTRNDLIVFYLIESCNKKNQSSGFFFLTNSHESYLYFSKLFSATSKISRSASVCLLL